MQNSGSVSAAMPLAEFANAPSPIAVMKRPSILSGMTTSAIRWFGSLKPTTFAVSAPVASHLKIVSASDSSRTVTGGGVTVSVP